jgi:pSer/pThr/pTyr-binding forkhead associated (FHA) protein
MLVDDAGESPIAPPLDSLTSEIVGRSIKFQSIELKENGEETGKVIERNLNEGDHMRLGRLMIRDGQQILAGSNKKQTDLDIWFSSHVVSRIHAEMCLKDGLVLFSVTKLYMKDIGSSSGTFLNRLRLSPLGKESRPYPVNQDDILQLGIDYKGKDGVEVFKRVILRAVFFDRRPTLRSSPMHWQIS